MKQVYRHEFIIRCDQEVPADELIIHAPGEGVLFGEGRWNPKKGDSARFTILLEPLEGERPETPLDTSGERPWHVKEEEPQMTGQMKPCPICGERGFWQLIIPDTMGHCGQCGYVGPWHGVRPPDDTTCPRCHYRAFRLLYPGRTEERFCDVCGLADMTSPEGFTE